MRRAFFFPSGSLGDLYDDFLAPPSSISEMSLRPLVLLVLGRMGAAARLSWRTPSGASSAAWPPSAPGARGR